MWKMVLQSLKMRTAQVVSMMLTVAISVMVILATVLIYGGIDAGIKLTEQRGGADLMVMPNEASGFLADSDILFTGVPAAIYMDASLVDQIAGLDYVERVSGQFYGQSLNDSCCSTTTETRLIGVDFDTDWVVRSFAHADLSEGLAPDEIVVGCDVGGYEGGSGSLLGHEVRAVDTLDRSGSELDHSIIMDIDAVRQLSTEKEGFDHLWEEYGQPAGLVSTVLVDVEDGKESILASRIMRLGNVSVVQRSALIDQAQGNMQSLFVVLIVFAVLMAVAAVLQYVSRFYSLVWERKSELALYRALGATKGDLMRIIGGEALAITVVGLVAGTVLGFVFSGILLALMQDGGAFPFAALAPPLQAGVVAAIAVFFIAVALLVTLIPMRQVSRIDPASAMSQTDIG